MGWHTISDLNHGFAAAGPERAGHGRQDAPTDAVFTRRWAISVPSSTKQGALPNWQAKRVNPTVH